MTSHDDEFAAWLPSPQLCGENALPGSLLELNVTVPLGWVFCAVSVTVAVQLVHLVASTDVGEHETAVVVGSVKNVAVAD